MKIKTWIKYMEGYYPTERSRKLRYKEQEDYIDVELTEANRTDVKLALEVENVKYFLYNNQLFTKATSRDISCFEIENPLENLKHCNEHCSSYFGFEDDDTREKMITKANEEIKKYLLIDNEIYKQDDEPVYAIYCFGLGNNHSGIGTSLSITKANIAKCNCGCYFNAFDREKAINEALKTANNRGDTDSIEYIVNTPVINVIIPDVIKTITNMNN